MNRQKDSDSASGVEGEGDLAAEAGGEAEGEVEVGAAGLGRAGDG